MDRERAERIRVAFSTVRDAIATYLYENDRHGYFEVSIDGESQGWFFVDARRAIYTTPERIGADPTYGPKIRKAFEDAIVKIEFESWAEFFDKAGPVVDPEDFKGLPVLDKEVTS